MPSLNLLLPLPFLKVYPDHLQVGDGLHELRDWTFVLQNGIGKVEPKLVFVLREGWPDFEVIPTVSCEIEPESLKIPTCDSASAGTALKHLVEFLQELGFILA